MYLRSRSKELQTIIRVEEECVGVSLVITNHSLESVDLKEEKTI